MSIASALGLTESRKVRYAVVGLGDIAQASMMPGIAHTGNSELVALVTGDPEKAEKVGKQYGIADTYSYERFGEMLASGKVDAIYLATPNWRHAEFAVPALEAGIHVLCEKPLEISVEKSEAIAAAAKKSGAKLMVAYRLHFEPATLDAITRIRDGELGELIAFTSCFGQMVDPANHRARNGIEAGPLFDMGPYPINATRYLFGAEPEGVVSAVATRQPDSGLDVDDTFAVTLRFPGNRLAQFTISYFVNNVNSLIIAGAKGSIHMSPAYGFGDPLEQNRTVGDKKTHESFKATDQFGGEMKYFSDCILHDREVEPDGEEGIADLRVIEGIVEALKTGKAVTLPAFTRSRRIDPEGQVQTLSYKRPPRNEVNASSPTR
ncbi:Gfo/Idh/MocA family protein [Sphingomonas rubra]|uniref:Predicted dehydrogenase n=1 Tax=Sphingomonas rubra TaxID=634430 RepID=A0A1I5UDA3_9SPHN|nr:Gfo/Idh/MocA family oxidoreductase [Sphingomonas rubra]SFP93204.1 Predicted dehydrogenase [Sphingomonas rubra]